MKYDLTLAFRNIRKRKTISFINILGLAFGFAFVILAGRYIYTEKTFDEFHENSASIYRIEINHSEYGPSCFTSNIMLSFLKDNVPEAKEATRIINDGGLLGPQRILVYNNIKYNIDKPLIIDPDFFSMFSFQLLAGEIESFNRDKYSIVLVESFAKKIFGDENPVGKIVKYKDDLFTVKAIVKEPPANSSIKFDLLLPIENKPEYATDDWRNGSLQTFILASGNISHLELQQKINSRVMSVLKSLGYLENNRMNQYQYKLNPITNIYYSEYQFDNICIHGNSKLTYLLSSVAVVVLLIAMINFMNISLIKASERVKELGVRATSGASGLDNIRLLIYDSIIPCLIASILAIAWVYEIEPIINPLLNVPMVNMSLSHLVIIVVAFLTLGTLAGLYPALKLSSYNIIDSLKGKTKKGKSALFFRSTLSVAQFVASIALIISMFVIYNQIDYVVKQSGTNLDKNLVLYLSLSDKTPEKSQKIYTIQKALKLLLEVEEVSSCIHLPGDELYSNWKMPLKYKTENETEILTNHNMVDARYPETMGYEIIRGRTFNPEIKSDEKSYIVNEAFIKKYNIQNIEDTFILGCPIIGVVKDFHFLSLHEKIEPLAIRYLNSYQSRIVVRLTTDNITSLSGVIDKIKETANSIDDTAISDINFLDEHIAALYDKEKRISQILLWLSVFSILISCMGLFSMSLFTIEARTKEIGIRKVVGATVSGIVFLITKQFIQWVLIANLIAWPIAYYFMNKWLEDFVYRINITWWMFALSGGIALVIALATVSFQAIKAAIANPIDSLRYE
ncbi:MAG: ABC transporter permease [Ignavibacteria bacterium]|jgi:putative ABC transport system permease protein